MRSKTKKIVFRVSEPMYEFIKDWCKANGISISEYCRDVLTYFQMGYLMGEFQKSLPELKEEFIKRFGKERRKKKK